MLSGNPDYCVKQINYSIIIFIMIPVSKYSAVRYGLSKASTYPGPLKIVQAEEY